MIAVAIAALAFCDPQVTTLLVISATSLLAIRSLLIKPASERPRSWAVPFLVSLACLYLPFAWVLGDYPWDGYRWHWIKLSPVLPGLIAGMFVHPNDYAMTLISGAVTLTLLALFTMVGRSGRVGLVVGNGIALIGAGLESAVAYQLFLF